MSELLQVVDLIFKFLDFLAFPFIVLTLIVFFISLFAGKISLRGEKGKDPWYVRWFG